MLTFFSRPNRNFCGSPCGAQKECRGLRLRMTFIHRTALSTDLWPCVIQRSLEQIILTEAPPSSAFKEGCVLFHEEWLSLKLESPSKHHSVFFILLILGFYVLSLPQFLYCPLLSHSLVLSTPVFLFPHSFAFVNVPSSLNPPILASWTQRHAGNNISACEG